MRRIVSAQYEPLLGVSATRSLEVTASAQCPPHTLMARAGQAVAQLARALAPHSRDTWIACGPGNNGGDGLVAATHLHRHATEQGGRCSVWVTIAGDTAKLPKDAAHAFAQAQAAGVNFLKQPPAHVDFAVDALLGIGIHRAPEGVVAEHLAILNHFSAPVLCVDIPSGLDADTGCLMPVGATPAPRGPRHTLSLLTLKPGLFTAQGRDAGGDVWLDDLGIAQTPLTSPDAWLVGMPSDGHARPLRHTSHKGTHGEVLVVGGQAASETAEGMTGAAILAARAALHLGAGRVYVNLLNEPSAGPGWDPIQPELMFRQTATTLHGDLIERSTVVCGCGGGQAVKTILPHLLARARRLVLDADALNALAMDPMLQDLAKRRRVRGWTTVMTPHPLEAARLLYQQTAEVMADRIAAAQKISQMFGAICVLKGSGSVITEIDQIPLINSSGNGSLATAGTGDVLAGMLGAALSAVPDGTTALTRVAKAVFHHGQLADAWVENNGLRPLTAHQLTAEGHRLV